MTLERFQQAADEDVDKQVRRFNRELTRHYATARDEIQAELERLYARVLDGVEPDRYYAVAVKYDRLTKLQQQVRDAYLRAARRAGESVRQASRLAMGNTFYANQYALAATVGEAQGLTLAFTRMPEDVVGLAVSGASDRFAQLERRYRDRLGPMGDYVPSSGSTLREILLNRRDVDLKRVQDTITQALIQGKSVSRATTELTRSMAMSRNNAERIIRTETHRTRSLGHYAASQNAKAQGARIRRQISSVLDDRTRPQSAQVDGLMENDNGQFAYPGGVMVTVPGNSGVAGWDINDRERTIDVVEGWDLETRRARNPATGENEVIGMQSFQRWAEANGLTRNRYGQWVAG
jgi:uncharacterized protein GlcG (DUF336 family)/polyhydroxyalkanoate synthesis regulator phasin